jgi:cation:H+ antiporter
MLVPSVLAVAGLVLLAIAADHLVLGASRLTGLLGISPVVVGVVVIGFGTSTPELLVSWIAAARGEAGIAVGNIGGSNILNLTLILGLAAVIRPISVSSSVIRREVRLSVVAVAIFAVLAWIGLSIGAGIVLILALAGALFLLVRWAGRGRNAEIASEAAEFTAATAVVDVPVPPVRVPAWAEAVRTVLGLAGVLTGAQLLVAGASTIAEHMGVPQVVIGLTLVAFGTSVPELVTSIAAQRRGESDLVVGNLFGSNLFNGLAVGAVVCFVSGRAIADATSVALLIVMVLTAIIAGALLRRGLRLTRPEGMLLLAIYIGLLPLVLAG